MAPRRYVVIASEGHTGAAKAPEHGVEMETVVPVTAGELLLHPDCDAPDLTVH